MALHQVDGWIWPSGTGLSKRVKVILRWNIPRNKRLQIGRVGVISDIRQLHIAAVVAHWGKLVLAVYWGIEVTPDILHIPRTIDFRRTQFGDYLFTLQGQSWSSPQIHQPFLVGFGKSSTRISPIQSTVAHQIRWLLSSIIRRILN